MQRLHDTDSLRERRVVEDGYEVRRRRRSGWPALLAILIVLGGIILVADRVAAQAASNELRAQLASELSDRGVGYQTMDVSIEGVPFLTQVAENRYEKIAIDMTEVRLPASQAGAGEATLPVLHVVATGVEADATSLIRGIPTQVTADEVSGSAVVSYGTLETLVDYSRYRLRDVRFTSTDGALHASGTADVAGIDIPITAVAEIAAVDGQFQVNLREVTAVGVEAPQIVKDYLDDLAQNAVTARLPDLPFSLTLDQVSPGAGGLAITATGRGVTLVA
jgi:hypothetical protein